MKKCLSFTVLLFLALSVASAQKSWFKAEANPKTPYKNPGSTFISALLVPGTGYMANDKLCAGFSFLGAELALGGVGAFYLFRPIEGLSTGAAVKAQRDSYQRTAVIFLSAAGAIHAFQLVHSTLLTHRINKLNGFTALHSNKKPVFSVGTSGAGLNFQLRF